MSISALKEKLLSIGVKPGEFRKYWGLEVKRVIEDYEKIEKPADSQGLLEGLLRSQLDALVIADPRIVFVPRFRVRLEDGFVAVKFEEADMVRLEAHWNKFAR